MFAGIVAKPTVLDQIGAAMNSGRAMFLYGPAGSGKTFLAEHLRGLMKGSIVVPHAIVVGNEIIQVFDPLVHEPVESSAPTGGAFDRPAPRRRPLGAVQAAGGRSRAASSSSTMLDLDYDEGTRFYQAPPHVKANNGIYVVDDLGRQLVAPRDLMNRWIVPLDRRKDYLSLRTGHKFAIPFDVVVVFSTNLRPADLVDEAFLRRLGYKIYLGPMSEDEYRAVFEGVCTEFGIAYSEPMLQHLLRQPPRPRGQAAACLLPARHPFAAARLRDLRGRPRRSSPPRTSTGRGTTTLFTNEHPSDLSDAADRTPDGKGNSADATGNGNTDERKAGSAP